MKINKIVFLFLLLFATITFADGNTATDLHPFTSQYDADRFYNLTQEIRCVVCQNQNIADSNAPLANDLREKVYQMVVDQQTDAEIKEFLVKRYGEFILLRPRWNGETILLWIFPVLLLSVAGVILYRRF